jgi:acetylornithine deacetylase/succinyl-diaminopimelate desuccinylase-like protein
MQAWKDYQEKNKDRFLSELFELLRIPSVSAKTEHKEDMIRCADAIKKRLQEAGADKVEIYPTEGHPIVFAEKIFDPTKPTVLVYGHYDVQPAEPLELWNNDPFEPTIVDGKIFARGSCDDKGQVYMHVKAFETMVQTNSLFCNVKFCIEGEEEVGSPNLGKFVSAHKDLLKADCVLISDSAMISLENPSIDIGVRGLSYIEVEITGPNRDLHSGVYGGAVANPITILAKMIASLHDENNHITIPGFYDDVVVATADERALMAKAPFNEKEYADERNTKKRYERILKNPYFNALQVKYAYAITCHKAQGGQWPIVFLDHDYLTEEMLNFSFLRWLYTGFTRASEKLFLVNFHKEFFENEIDE